MNVAQNFLKESQIQIACVNILRRLCPWLMFNHSPNEGKRTVGQKWHLIKMGMHSGWPDLEMLSDGKAYFVEFKRSKGGRIEPEQQQFADWCQDNGFKHAFCKSVSEFEDILNEWGFIRKDALGVLHLIKKGGGLPAVPAELGDR